MNDSIGKPDREERLSEVAGTAPIDQIVFTFTDEQWDALQRRLDEPARAIPAVQQLHADCMMAR
jgi:hypothetical protein